MVRLHEISWSEAKKLFEKTALLRASATRWSVPKGLCGPCCSVLPTGRMATSVFSKSFLASLQLISCNLTKKTPVNNL